MEKIKAYFNAKKGGYLLFLPDGEIIPYLMDVTISDNFDTSHGHPNPTATFKCEVDIINSLDELKPITDEVE